MILVTKLYRSSIVENFHIGYAVAVDEKGDVLFSAGDSEYPVYIRSTANPFQVVPLLESGAMEKFNLNDEEIAVMCSSHNGEPYHVEAVSNILNKIGVKIDDLVCGIQPPLDRLSYEQMILKGRRTTAIYNTCSGNHACMIALSKALDVSHNNYTSSNHPVQIKIFEKIKYYSEKDKIPIAIDSCNVPTFFLPLKNIALMYKKLIEGSDEYLRKIVHIMCLHPKHIAGRNRFDTDFTTVTSGKGISKIGSAGVRGIGVRTEDGRYIGIAMKVLSGNKQAADSMAVAIMKHLKLIDEEALEKLNNYHCPVLKNNSDIETGKIVTEIVLEENE